MKKYFEEYALIEQDILENKTGVRFQPCSKNNS